MKVRISKTAYYKLAESLHPDIGSLEECTLVRYQDGSYAFIYVIDGCSYELWLEFEKAGAKYTENQYRLDDAGAHVETRTGGLSEDQLGELGFLEAGPRPAETAENTDENQGD